MTTRNSKYSKYTESGDRNPEWGTTVEMLTPLLSDPDQPEAEKARAAEVLKWAAERSAYLTKSLGFTNSDLDRQVLAMMIELDGAGSLWESPER